MNQVTERSNVYDEPDLEQNSLQFNSLNDQSNITTGDEEEDSQEFRQLQRLTLDQQLNSKRTCADKFLSIMNGCLHFITKGFYYLALLVYHLFTTLIALTQAILFSTITLLFAFNVLTLNFAIWMFVVLSMLFLIFKICLQQLFPESQDLSGLFDMEVTSRRQRQQRRFQRGGRPQYINRRTGRRYDSEFISTRERRMREQFGQRQEIEVPMTELTTLAIPPHLRYRISTTTQNNDNQVITEDSSERLQTQGNDSIANIDEHMLRMQRHRDQRVHRELIRNEILRILTSSDFERQRHGSPNSFILRNLQYLQMSSVARDFNENDYEMLSSLDSNNSRMSSSKTHLLISQLPTYKFQSKKRQEKSQCAKDFEGDLEDKTDDTSLVNNQKNVILDTDENTHKNTCTICIEGFTDGDIVKILPCFHQFHSQCIDDWLLRKTLCPVCKFDIKQAAQNERMLNRQLQEVS